MVLACKDDEGPMPITSDFPSIASTYSETVGTITIPFRNATPAFVSNPEIKFSGSATQGSDFTLVGVTAEGIQLSIIDDNLIELSEVIKVRIGTTGNNIHEVTIVSNCEDTESPYLGYFSGTYGATEKYGPNPPASNWYGPYDLTLVQDKDDPTKFSMTNFYDAGRGAYVKVDLDAGTIFFPNQTPSGSTRVLTNSSGTYTITPCGIEVEIALNYDGGDWVYGWTLEKN